MKKIKSENAIGCVLGADVTEIIPDIKKGPLFKRGHIIEQSDIEKLLAIGKHHIWICDENEQYIQEDDAAKKIMEALSGNFLKLSSPKESKVDLIAERDGVLLLNRKGLFAVNRLKNPKIATMKHLSFIRRENVVAIGKIMNVEISANELKKIVSTARKYHPIVNLLPLRQNRIVIFPVGNEFIEKRSEETMSFKVKHYLESLGQNVDRNEVLPDNELVIAEQGKEALKKGYDIVIYMGGISVDPDDRTTFGIKKIGGNIVTYGVPLWPGITFMISYKNEKPILGIPSFAGFAKGETSFHRLMPIILSGYKLSKNEILEMSDGGFINATNL